MKIFVLLVLLWFLIVGICSISASQIDKIYETFYEYLASLISEDSLREELWKTGLRQVIIALLGILFLLLV